MGKFKDKVLSSEFVLDEAKLLEERLSKYNKNPKLVKTWGGVKEKYLSKNKQHQTSNI